MVDVLDGSYSIRWESKVLEDAKELFMADSIEGICEVQVKGIEVLVGSGGIFDYVDEALDLTSRASSNPKAFLAVAKNITVLGEIREDDRHEACPHFIDRPVQANRSLVAEVCEVITFVQEGGV